MIARRHAVAAARGGADGTVALPGAAHGRSGSGSRSCARRSRRARPAATRQRRAVGIAEIRGTGVPRARVAARGRSTAAASASSTARVGEPPRAACASNGTIEDLDAGPPAARRRAASRSTLPAGPDAAERRRPGRSRRTCCACARRASTPARRRRRARGRRRAPRPAAAATGVRLALDAPARLVLAESFNRGRRASCDGRDLGEPEVGAAFGTAWRVPGDLPRGGDRVRARTAW